MSETASLESLLNQPLTPAKTSPEPQDSPQTGEAPKPADTPQLAPEAAVAPAEAQQTGEQPNGATPAPNAQDPESAVKEARAFQKAAEDERKKRQNLERALEEERARFAEFQAQLQRQQTPQAQPPEYLDPDGAQYLNSQFQTALQKHQQEMILAKVEQSQEIMRFRHEDYDEIEKVFAEAASTDPTLWDKLYAHPLPAKFAYQVGKSVKAMNEIGSDPDAYRAKLAKEIEDKLRAEFQSSLQPQPAQTPQAQTPAPSAPLPPPSLAGVPSASANVAQAYQGPTPLDQLLNQPLFPNRRR